MRNPRNRRTAGPAAAAGTGRPGADAGRDVCPRAGWSRAVRTSKRRLCSSPPRDPGPYLRRAALALRRRPVRARLQRENLQPRVAAGTQRPGPPIPLVLRHGSRDGGVPAVGRRVRSPVPRDVRVRTVRLRAGSPAARSRPLRHQVAVPDRVDGDLVFASSIAALLQHPRLSKSPNIPAISHYLTTF